MKDKTTTICYIFFIALFSILPNISIAQAGSLDLTFDSDGKVINSIGSGNFNDSAHSVTIQQDGKIIVGGYSYNTTVDFALIRLNPDGTIDNSFGTNGKVITPIGNAGDVIASIALQTDGKIVAAGTTWTGVKNEFCIVRYNSNGSIDVSFDTDGKVIVSAGDFEIQCTSMIIQNDGKILVAGAYWNSGNDIDIALVRFNTNGSIDSSFGNNGKVITDIGNTNNFGSDVAVDINGKIIVVGTNWNGTDQDFAIVRYNADGSLDTSFGSTGKITTPIGNSDEQANSVVITPNGKILVSGFTWNGIDSDFAIVSYKTNGDLDANFGNNGKITTNINNSNDLGKSLLLQSDGKILLGGYSENEDLTNSDFSLVRYNANGSLDTSFDNDGIVTTDFSAYDNCNDIAMQTDGKIVAVGSTYEIGFEPDFAIARYNNDVLSIKQEEIFSTIIYPNPFKTFTNIQLNTAINNGELTIYDVLGKQVKVIQNIYGENIMVNRENLMSGLYFIKITEESKLIAVKKITITD